MNKRSFNSIVSNTEQEALKDMIFKRARERAQAMNEEVQNSYTGLIQNDVMDLARDSFVAQKNPFSQIVENVEVESAKKEQEIGFAKRHVKEIKSQISNKQKVVNNEIINSQVENAMADARGEFARKKSFMGALDFLNSQASISLVKSHGKTFEAFA